MATATDQRKLVKAACQRYRSIPWIPLSQKQRETSHDAPARGGFWISRTTFKAPSDSGLRDALYQIIDVLKSDYHQITPARDTSLIDVGVEFIGARAGVASDAPEPDVTEDEKLKELERECKSDLTILYIHGGGLYFSCPADYRSSSARLARMTKARVASIKYRLAPAHTFPAPILDTILAYASLIYPPPGATYSAVPADRIVLAGNSAGANLCFALTKFLLELQKMPSTVGPDSTIKFHGKAITLPLPLGIATVSGWCDQCDALPSWHSNGEYDILGVLQPACMPNHPTDEIWPSNPPREHPYCAASTLDHELVTPAAVRDWTGAPPMWFACGCEERGLDGNKVVASQASKAGVTVTWNEYEGMPHEFPLIMGKLPQARHAFGLWAAACKEFTVAQVRTSTATRWLMPECGKMKLGSPRDLSPLPFEEIRKKMREYNATRPVWNGRLWDPRL